MKKYTIQKAKKITNDPSTETSLSFILEGYEEMTVSDGFHTMDELYAHRIQLFIALAKLYNMQINEFVLKTKVWRSEKHHDGTGYDGWFILGINDEYGKQITYHLPMSYWEETNFADTLSKAPDFDGHTSADVLQRLKTL